MLTGLFKKNDNIIVIHLASYIFFETQSLKCFETQGLQRLKRPFENEK